MAPPPLKMLQVLLIRQEHVQDPDVAVLPSRKPLLPLLPLQVVKAQKAAARLEPLPEFKNRYRWRRPPPA